MYQALELTAPLLCLFNYQLLQVLQATTLPDNSYTILIHNSSTSSRNGSLRTLPAKGHISAIPESVRCPGQPLRAPQLFLKRGDS